MKTQAKKGTTTAKAAVAPKKKTTRKTVAKKTTKTPVEAKVDDANATSTVKEITEQKDLKYIYPSDATTLEKRKTFRSRVRAEVRKLEKQIKRLEVSNLEEDQELLVEKYKEQEKLYQRVYTKEYITNMHS